MKSTRTQDGGIDLSQMSIPEAEEIVEEALNELAFSSDPGLARALRFLAPPGYQAIVELCGENGRSKRRNAAADSWSPEDDEVRIYFERVDDGEAIPRQERAPRVLANHTASRTSNHNGDSTYDDEGDDGQEAVIPADLDARVLKWFRDSFLPRKAFRWNQLPESRQAVLAEAIQRGVVVTSKIANPKTPAYPTTTIRLNRAEAGIPEEAQRFHPVQIHGDSIAEAIQEERIQVERGSV
jgi:hypothetical protein